MTPPDEPLRDDRAAPMSSAPFVWRVDGRPDWATMWASFCDLALHGGPPHRGRDTALRGAPDGGQIGSSPEMVEELRRGIVETTGLRAELATPGWLAVTCDTPEMARWLDHAIRLENVESRIDGVRLLVPAGPDFRLEDEVKSVITVVAKTHHYWRVHSAMPAPAVLSLGGIPRPVKVGIGGPPGSGKTTLIHALKRSLGPKLAIAWSAREIVDVGDPAVDLVVWERTTDAFEPEHVDAAIGVVDVGAAMEYASRAVSRTLTACHLLVVSKIDLAADADVDRARLTTRIRRQRGDRPVVYADLHGATSIAEVSMWLEQELLIGM
jgi:Ni2+-binding GTPase involved in maturation of urease and hydrogenase